MAYGAVTNVCSIMSPACRFGPNYFFRRGARCERALAAAVLDVLLVRRSRRTLDAALAARDPVFLLLAMLVPLSSGGLVVWYLDTTKACSQSTDTVDIEVAVQPPQKERRRRCREKP